MNFNALDLNLIRVFDALAQERSVTRAGERIGLSQPAVSSALNRLRHVFNDALFVRQGHEMLPTPLAEELAGRVRSALREIEGMVDSRRPLVLGELDRTFTLMGADFFSMLLMPALARRVSGQAPKVRLRIIDSARGDVVRLLQESGVDIALERPLDVPDWISDTLLFKSPFALIAAAGNPDVAGIADGAVLPMETFCRLPHAIRSIDGSMSGMVDAALEASGRRRHVTLALPQFQAVALAVASGPYIAAVPLQFARAVHRELRLRLFRPPVDVPVPDVRLYWHSRHEQDAAHRWMRDEIMATVRELGWPDDCSQ